MGLYPPRAVERAMKIQEVILRAIGGEINWIQAAEIIGTTTSNAQIVGGLDVGFLAP